MFKWAVADLINDTEAFVSLEIDNPNQSFMPAFSGDKEIVDDLKRWLPNASGAFGHLLGTVPTAIDIDSALQDTEYSIELIEGVLDQYDPAIPEDAIT